MLGMGVVAMTLRMRTSGLLTAASVLVLLLAACGGTDPGSEETGGGEPESPSVSSPATPTPTPTAEPEPTSDPHPVAADLVISTAGLGPLTVGTEPPETNPGSAMLEWDEDFCAGAVEGDAEPGRWVASGYEPDVSAYGEPVRTFAVAADDEGVHRIDVLGVAPATAAGIRVGSSLTDLQAAYPELEGPFAGPVSQVWTWGDDEGTVAFETQGDAGGLRPAGTPEGVVLIRILALGEPADFAAANSGNVADACF